MILDKLETFSDSQAVTTDVVGTNVIDLVTSRSLSTGEPMCVLFAVEVAADATTGDEDYTFQVELSSDTAQTTGRVLLGKRIFESGTPDAPAQASSLLAAGFRFTIPLPPLTLSECARYLGVRYDTLGNTPTITVSAYLLPISMAEVTNPAYPKGYLN